MSFSGEIKEELSKQLSTGRHCQIAELAAIISICGSVCMDEQDRYTLKIATENLSVLRKYFTLLKKAFNIKAEISQQKNQLKKHTVYVATVPDDVSAKRVLSAVKLLKADGEIEEELSVVKNVVIQENCCKRAFIRGAFLASGSMSDPNKSYHFEIVCATMKKALQIQRILQCFRTDAKIVNRKKSYVVYLKEGEQIADILTVMEAHVALMKLENIRILKDMRNTVNRKVNCETANINKTVSAAVKQLEDITYIKETVGFDKLSDALRDAALTRLAYPEATLQELGELLPTPVGKSGMNHRLRKLSEIAEKLRENKEVLL